jgi:hypothetical protein
MIARPPASQAPIVLRRALFASSQNCCTPAADLPSGFPLIQQVFVGLIHESVLVTPEMLAASSDPVPLADTQTGDIAWLLIPPYNTVTFGIVLGQIDRLLTYSCPNRCQVVFEPLDPVSEYYAILDCRRVWRNVHLDNPASL